MREHIGDKPELWAVVKANAYGHGAVAVAQHIDGLVDGFVCLTLMKPSSYVNN